MGIRKVEIIKHFCDFCDKEVQDVVSLNLDLSGDRGDFELCQECADLFHERFFNSTELKTSEFVGEPDDESEDEDALVDDEEDEEELVGEEDEYDLDDDIYEEEEEEEEDEEEFVPPPPPKKKATKKTAGRKKKVSRQGQYGDPLAGINLGEKDDTIVRADGTVREGKVLKQLKKAASSERRGVVKHCPAGECEYDEDTGRCSICGLKKGETGVREGAAPAHDPIQAHASGQQQMGVDPYTGAVTFPVDVNSDQVQRRMKRNLRRQNDSLRKKYGKSGRYFNLDPTDGAGRGR